MRRLLAFCQQIITPEMRRLQLVIDEQSHLVGIMRTIGPRRRPTEGLNRARGHTLARKPLDPHDKAVPMPDAKAAIFVHIPGGRSAQSVRSAIQRQVNIPLPQSQKIAPGARSDERGVVRIVKPPARRIDDPGHARGAVLLPPRTARSRYRARRRTAVAERIPRPHPSR